MENIFKNLHSNQKILIYEMLKRGINVELLSEKLELIKTSYQGHVEFIYDRDSSIMPYHVSVLAGNKGITKKILQDNEIKEENSYEVMLKNPKAGAGCVFALKNFGWSDKVTVEGGDNPVKVEMTVEDFLRNEEVNA